MPESYDHVVLCDSCEEPMHLTCYLMGNLSIANAIPQLFCYSCREVGNYKFLPGSEEINREMIVEAATKVATLQQYQLFKHLPDVRNNSKKVPNSVF